MRYVPTTDPSVLPDLETDLSGLTIGSSFILVGEDAKFALLRKIDALALAEYERQERAGQGFSVATISLELPFFIGLDSLVPIANLPEDAVILQTYRYFDTPRETLVYAVLASPHEIAKTKETTFFCGPDRRKGGDFRVFSLHPGPKRQPFPNRYQDDAERQVNRSFWDRSAFYATPNQIITAMRMMRSHYRELEPEARDRVFHMTRLMDGGLHHWFKTWEQPTEQKTARPGQITETDVAHGDYVMLPDHVVYYVNPQPGQPRPNLEHEEERLSGLSNAFRPSIIRADASVEFYLNGKRHHNGGPALFKPLPDGGWLEEWYEDGLISRAPEEGPAHIIYDASGKIVEEISYYKGGEVQSAVLGEAADSVKALQDKVAETTRKINAFAQSPDYRLIASQLQTIAGRKGVGLDKVVREMAPGGDQLGMRWDFDHMLNQDPRVAAQYQDIIAEVKASGEALIEAAKSMRLAQGDSNIIGAIWGKVLRECDRLQENGYIIPGEPGKTVVDGFITDRQESKRHFQSATEVGKAFSATGK